MQTKHFLQGCIREEDIAEAGKQDRGVDCWADPALPLELALRRTFTQKVFAFFSEKNNETLAWIAGVKVVMPTYVHEWLAKLKGYRKGCAPSRLLFFTMPDPFQGGERPKAAPDPVEAPRAWRSILGPSGWAYGPCGQSDCAAHAPKAEEPAVEVGQRSASE